MISYKPPTYVNKKGSEGSIFLAGTIDMGDSVDWQAKLEKDLADVENLVIYNPRRDDWDKTWPQDPTPGTNFHGQVQWELDHLECSDIAVFYFADGSKSPITLMELGLMAGNPRKEIVIYCTPNFYRYGNVKIMADRYHLDLFSDYNKFVNFLRKRTIR